MPQGDGGGENIDPTAWIRYVGIPTAQAVEGLKRAFWVASGTFFGSGLILGLLAPYLLKKWGLA